jgi:hypothetical protein
MHHKAAFYHSPIFACLVTTEIAFLQKTYTLLDLETLNRAFNCCLKHYAH